MKKIAGIELHNLKETSTILGLGIPAIRTAIKDKKLVARKIGNSYFVTESDIKQFLNIN